MLAAHLTAHLDRNIQLDVSYIHIDIPIEHSQLY